MMIAHQSDAYIAADGPNGSVPVSGTLATERLQLRRPQASDLDAYRSFYTSPRSRFQGGPYSDAQCFEKLAAMIGHWELRGFGRYVIEFNGRAVGHAGPLQIEDDAPPELTWSLWSRDVEGHGLATEAASTVARHLLVNCGWPLLVILILPDNVKSLRVAERLGARRTDDAAPEWYQGAHVLHMDKECLTA